MAKRRNFTDQFKAKVALEALRGNKTVQEIAAKHQLHPNQVSTWKRQAIDGMADVFSGGKQSGSPGLRSARPNQVWCADITFVPVKNGFLYLGAIMDWATRKVLSWRLSNTMHADFCVEALNEAVAKHGPPEIMNTDQGSQFTGSAWITTLTEAGVRISMDGRGRYLDNIFIERLWRSLKQEAIYLEEINDGFQARKVVKDWMAFYNTNRPHSALDRRTPDEAYWDGREEQKAA